MLFRLPHKTTEPRSKIKSNVSVSQHVATGFAPCRGVVHLFVVRVEATHLRRTPPPRHAGGPHTGVHRLTGGHEVWRLAVFALSLLFAATHRVCWGKVGIRVDLAVVVATVGGRVGVFFVWVWRCPAWIPYLEVIVIIWLTYFKFFNCLSYLIAYANYFCFTYHC